MTQPSTQTPAAAETTYFDALAGIHTETEAAAYQAAAAAAETAETFDPLAGLDPEA